MMSLEEGPFVFRVNDNGSGPNLLIQVCLERGWKEFKDKTPFSNGWNLWWKTQAFPVFQKPLMPWQVMHKLFYFQVCMERGWREYTESNLMKDSWNLWWKTSAFAVSQHRHLKAWQFTNHIPKGASICRKDNLARNLKCMKKVYGAVYDICPHGYNLPLEYTKLVADCSRFNDDSNECQKVWICKPVGQSQGRGIFLFKDLSDLCYDSNAVVQRYINNPLLIGGYKFDLRLYVCVPSYHPLTIYLYKEGIVRFSTDKFSLSDLSNPFCHLTNSSLNKLGPGYAEQKDRVGAGCKWSFKQLRQYFQQAGIRDWLLWQKISALVTLTILSQTTSVPQTTNCFEFYGFDVLIDDKLKPWLLEVNLSPALGYDCDVDPVVKKPLLHDLFDLLGLPVCNTGLSLFTVFSPLERKSLLYNNNANSDNEGRNDEHRRIPSIKFKYKTLSNARGSGCKSAIGIKSTTSSALLVATAATKWRRKRKSSYLFGPPQRNGVEEENLKINESTLKPSIVSISQNAENNSELHNSKREDDIKEKPKSINLTNDIKEVKHGKKTSSIVRRIREKDEIHKIKVCNSISDTQNRKKTNNGHSLVKTVSCSGSFKNFTKLDSILSDNINKKKKKIEALALEQRHVKSRKTETKICMGPEKSKKLVTIHGCNTKQVIFPFDKCSSSAKGFKGRTKLHSPVLWGNGRDWRSPVHKEGDWGRIYPLNNFNSNYRPTFEEDHLGNKFSVGDKQIRLVVHHITNFIKISKQIYCKGINATEEELNSQLIKLLGMTGDVWLPSK